MSFGSAWPEIAVLALAALVWLILVEARLRDLEVKERETAAFLREWMLRCEQARQKGVKR